MPTEGTRRWLRWGRAISRKVSTLGINSGGPVCGVEGATTTTVCMRILRRTVLLHVVESRLRSFRYRYRIPVSVTVSGTVKVLNGTRY